MSTVEQRVAPTVSHAVTITSPWLTHPAPEPTPHPECGRLNEVVKLL